MYRMPILLLLGLLSFLRASAVAAAPQVNPPLFGRCRLTRLVIFLKFQRLRRSPQLLNHKRRPRTLLCPAGTNNNAVFVDDVSTDATDWVALHISGEIAKLWAKGVPPTGTGITTRAWFAGNSLTNGIGDQTLTSPPITLPAASNRPITLQFVTAVCSC